MQFLAQLFTWGEAWFFYARIYHRTGADKASTQMGLVRKRESKSECSWFGSHGTSHAAFRFTHTENKNSLKVKWFHVLSSFGHESDQYNVRSRWNLATIWKSFRALSQLLFNINATVFNEVNSARWGFAREMKIKKMFRERIERRKSRKRAIDGESVDVVQWCCSCVQVWEVFVIAYLWFIHGCIFYGYQINLNYEFVW